MAALVPARGRRLAALLMAGAALALAACSDSGDTATASTPTPAPVVTTPSVLDVRRGETSCYVLQKSAANIPNVKSYRLADTRQLPEGLAPSVRAVRFQSGGANRVLEAEICFTADGNAPLGRQEAQLELRLYSVDSEKLVTADRIAPVRVLPFTQVVHVK